MALSLISERKPVALVASDGKWI